MTRINCIDPKHLTRQHLVAEYRELPRVFALAKAAIERGETPAHKSHPPAYTLSTGHVKFFYSRLGYCLRRQKELIAECQRRGYNVQHTNPEALCEGIPEEWMRDWTPCKRSIEINYLRIMDRGGFLSIKEQLIVESLIK